MSSDEHTSRTCPFGMSPRYRVMVWIGLKRPLVRMSCGPCSSAGIDNENDLPPRTVAAAS